MGVKRASSALSNPNSSPYYKRKAVSALNNHRIKSSSKIKQIETKNNKLESKAVKRDARAEKARSKIKRRGFTEFGREKSEHLLYKSLKYENKAKTIRQKIEKNKRIQETFKKGISEIDNTLVTKGHDFLYEKNR